MRKNTLMAVSGLRCVGDFHVWDHETGVCRCGAKARELLPRDPSLRDILERLDRIEHKLNIIFPKNT